MQYQKGSTIGAMLLAVLLAAATSADAQAGRSKRFGDYVVYYNAFDAGSRFTPYVAPGVEHVDDPGAGVVIVAVRRPRGAARAGDAGADESAENAEETTLEPISADVTGRVTNLLGQSAKLTFSQVESDGYVSYVADYDLERFPDAEFNVHIVPHDDDRPFDLEFEARVPERAD